MIVVLGATGNTGSRITELLLASGERVRAIGRSRERLQHLAELGAELAVGDLADTAFLRQAFAGAAALYTLIPPHYGAADFGAYQDTVGASIAAALADSAITHVVHLSSIGADQPSGTGPIAGVHRQEARLNALEDVHVVHLRPAFFLENHFWSLDTIRRHGINGSAIAGDVPMAMVATRDIADVAAGLLRDRSWTGRQVRELLGERDLTHDEVTAILGRHIGRPDLAYVQFPYADAEAAMAGAGLSADVARSFVEMARAFNEGRVRSLGGRTAETTTPTSIEQFVPALAGVFQSQLVAS